MRDEQVRNILPARVRQVIEQEPDAAGGIQEIRLRTGQPLLIRCGGRERIPGRAGPYIVTARDLRETVDYASNYSLYAYEEEMRQGFITIEGGHRVGLTGQVIVENGHVRNLKHISSVNIRVSHEVRGCSDKVFPRITYNRQVAHTLILSPPGCGKDDAPQRHGAADLRRQRLCERHDRGAWWTSAPRSGAAAGAWPRMISAFGQTCWTAARRRRA